MSFSGRRHTGPPVLSIRLPKRALPPPVQGIAEVEAVGVHQEPELTSRLGPLQLPAVAGPELRGHGHHESHRLGARIDGGTVSCVVLAPDGLRGVSGYSTSAFLSRLSRICQ